LPEVLAARARNGDYIGTTVYIAKTEVVATLRTRELHGRADWVEREMPALIDTSRNASLLQTLGIDMATMSVAGRHVAAGDPHR